MAAKRPQALAISEQLNRCRRVTDKLEPAWQKRQSVPEGIHSKSACREWPDRAGCAYWACVSSAYESLRAKRATAQAELAQAEFGQALFWNWPFAGRFHPRG